MQVIFFNDWDTNIVVFFTNIMCFFLTLRQMPVYNWQRRGTVRTRAVKRHFFKQLVHR